VETEPALRALAMEVVGVAKVWPTGGRQVFLLRVRLNGRPLLVSWRSRKRVPERLPE
jgi:hypothetical protein